MSQVLCEMKLNGLCLETERECLHAVPHVPVAQHGGGTCEDSGLCILFGDVRCLKTTAETKEGNSNGTSPHQRIELVARGG